MGAGLNSGSAHPDSTEFRDIIVEHDLCVLNTWRSGSKHDMLTFMNGDRSSQIDFFMLRRSHADCIARESCPLVGSESLDHSPWRGGGKHLAIACSIPLFPGWRTRPRKSGGGLGYDKQALEHAIRDDAQAVHAFRSRVASSLAEQQVVDVDVINAVLLETCQAVFPPRHVGREARPWQTEVVQCTVRQLWRARSLFQEHALTLQFSCGQHRRQVRVQRSRDHCRDRALLAHVFTYLKHHHYVQVIYKELKQKGKQARKAKLLSQLEKAGLAAERNDQKSLYQVIRTLAPKNRYKPVQTRGTDGAPISSQAEFNDIMCYFDSLYSQAEPGSDPQCIANHEARDRCELVTAEDMRWALKQNAIGKAVPKHHAPSGAWAICSGLLSSELAQVANSCLQGEITIPKRWSDCFLALIPTPNKRLTRPETLRPLGIQDAAGKSFARVLKRILLGQVSEVVYKYPQYAYLAKRSTYHAIDRVTQHCRIIRDELGHCTRNVQTKRLNHPIKKIAGGMQLSVDLSTAFDRVPRWALKRALAWAGADSNLIRVVDDLHAQCSYHIEHAGYTGSVNMRRGVRQGCTLAPLLFAIFTCYLADIIGKRTQITWMHEHFRTPFQRLRTP